MVETGRMSDDEARVESVASSLRGRAVTLPPYGAGLSYNRDRSLQLERRDRAALAFGTGGALLS